jgi:hypothetical protein
LPGDRDIDRPDVEIGARVTAKRLRFRRKPQVDVETHADVDADTHVEGGTTSGSERKNLPEEVEPGKTYRDVKVGWRAAARLEDPGR